MANFPGNPGPETIDGSNSADTITGLTGNDIINGLGGADTIDGGDDNDTIDGGAGNDTLIGGAGNDRFLFGARNFSQDTITDFQPGDIVDIAALGVADLDTLGRFITEVAGSVRIETFAGGVIERITLAGIKLADLQPSMFAFNISPSDLTINGSVSEDVLFGGNANDTLNGGNSPDTLTAGAGNDTLDGGSGNDILIGGAGNDIINGGTGFNTAVLSGARGASELRFEQVGGNFNIVVVGPDGIDTTTNVQRLQFGDRSIDVLGVGGVQHLVNVTFPGTSTSRYMIGSPYTGPVIGLTDEFVFPTPENINIASTLPNAFIRTGAGNDAITVFSGRNVVDAFTGSNFLTAGTGQDTFFLDARGGGVTWDTIVNFGIGDEVTLLGYIDGVSTDGFNKDTWYSSDGVDPFKGLTVHAKLDGANISASITFSGLTFADRDNLAVSVGTVGGSEYLYITRLA